MANPNPDVLLLVRHALTAYRLSRFKTNEIVWTISGAARRAAKVAGETRTERELFAARCIACGIPEDRAATMKLPGAAPIRDCLRFLAEEGTIERTRVRARYNYVPAWKVTAGKEYRVAA